MKPTRVNLLQTIVFASVVTLVQCDFKLIILHTNDMHSRFEETNAHSGPCAKGRGPCYGGFARVKAAADHYKEKAKAEGYHPIFLNAGDSYQGTVFYTMFKWKIVSELVNMLGIDVMSLGNHEFDDGPEGLTPFINASKVPIVCANIDYSKEPVFTKGGEVPKKLTKSYVLTVGEVKIGVIGYLTPDTTFLSHTGNVLLGNEVEAVKKEALSLKESGVDILITVGHAGYLKDKQIAEEVPEIDVVVGGHTNTFLYTGDAPSIEKIEGPYPTVVTQSSGRKVYVVQAYAYTKYLGHLKLTFDDNGEVLTADGEPILLTENMKKDPAVDKAIEKFSQQVKEKAGMEVGKTKTFIEADDKTCRVRECNFGNFVTDAMVHMSAKDHAGPGWTDAAIAFVQGGSLRTSIDRHLDEGDVTYADILTTMPFTNSVERLVITGETLMKVLEHSVEFYDPVERPGAFLQFSGVHVKYNLDRKAGSRVVSALVRCANCSVPTYEPLDPTKRYNVLTITFLAEGGDAYFMLKDALDRTVLSYTDVESVLNLMKQESPIHPENEGRVILVGSAAFLSHSVFTIALCLSASKLLTESLLCR